VEASHLAFTFPTPKEVDGKSDSCCPTDGRLATGIRAEKQSKLKHGFYRGPIWSSGSPGPVRKVCTVSRGGWGIRACRWDGALCAAWGGVAPVSDRF